MRATGFAGRRGKKPTCLCNIHRARESTPRDRMRYTKLSLEHRIMRKNDILSIIVGGETLRLL